MALYEREGATPSVSLHGFLQAEEADIDGSTEFGVADYMEAVETSGFLGITLCSALYREDLLEAYVQRVIDRDLVDRLKKELSNL